MNFLNNANLYLYKKEFKKTILCFLGFVLLFSLFTFYYEASKTSTAITDRFKQDEELILKDLKKLSLSYKRQISSVATNLQDITLTEKALEQYFNSDKASMLDRSVIDAILITDINQNLIYSDIQKINANTNSNIRIDKRDYFDAIKNEPKKIVFGNIVEGVLTKKPAIPIATNLINAENKICGYLIFSVTLENIASNLTNNNLYSIKLLNKPENSSNQLSSTNFSQSLTSFFLPLLFKNSDKSDKLEFVTFDEYSNKYVVLNYNTRPILQGFYHDSLVNILIFTIATGILAILYCLYVLIPMKKCITMIQNSPAEGSDIVNNNLFYYIRSSLYNQQLEIRNKDIAIQEQLARLIQVILSVSSISDYVSQKLTILTEDIADAGYSNKSHSKESELLVNDAVDIISNTNDGIRKTFANILDLLYVLGDDKKEDCYVTDVILQHLKTPELLHSRSNHPVRLYINLFNYLIQEIMEIDKTGTPLQKVNVNEDSTTMEFIFKSQGKDVISKSDNTLTLCRILGSFNKILVDIRITPDYFILTCNLKSS